MTVPRRKTNGHGANGGNGAATAAIVNQTISQQLSVTYEARRLRAAVQQGHLSERAQLELFTGEDRAVLEAVNGMLDAFIVPLTVTSTYIDRISKGDIPEKITDNYNGDFNTIKNNLNACIDGLGGLVEANKILQRMAVNDLTLSVQGAYNGIFAEVAAATNQIRDHLEHVVQVARHIAAGDYRVDLAELKKRGKRCDNDTIIPAYDAMMEAIDAMASDTEMLCQAALEGKLATGRTPANIRASIRESSRVSMERWTQSSVR